MLSKADLALIQTALDEKGVIQKVPSGNPKTISTPEEVSSRDQSISGSSRSNSSVGRSSPDATESGSSVPPDEDPDSDMGKSPSGTDTAVNIVPPSLLTGFVLFGVQGSKRLQSACLRLAQINIEVHKDDDSFFDEMIVQYKRLRGHLRWMFSIWVFHTCDFVMV